MSEHPHEPAGFAAGVDETGDTRSADANSPASAPSASLERDADSPSIVPDHEVLASGTTESDASRIEAFKGARTPDPGAVRSYAGRTDDPKPGMLIVMSPTDHARERDDFARAKAAETVENGKRRFPAMAAVIALAAAVGAISGALATAGVMKFTTSNAPSSAGDGAVSASIAQLNADMTALKSSIDQSAKAGASQMAKASDRLDKLEKTQTESRAKLTQLSDAVDKVRATPQASASPAAKEVTGSIAPPRSPAVAQPATPAARKTEVGRLPTIEDWRVLRVFDGGAIVEGRAGVFEVYPGDPVPGLGRIDAIRRQDGRWVVVTNRGLVVAR